MSILALLSARKGEGKMSRNVTIVVIILIIVLLAGYLVWLRGRYSNSVSNQEISVEASPTVAPTPTLAPTPSASASATPAASASAKVSAKPIKTASPSASVKK